MGRALLNLKRQLSNKPMLDKVTGEKSNAWEQIFGNKNRVGRRRYNMMQLEEQSKATNARKEYESNEKKRRKDIFSPDLARQELNAGQVQGNPAYSA